MDFKLLELLDSRHLTGY